MELRDVRLHSYWRSSCSWRVRIGLALKGVPYRYVPVNLLEGQQLADAYAERSPLRQVPCLEWDGGRLTQSLAILRLLDALEGPALTPADPLLGARAWELAEMVNAGIQPLQNLHVLRAIDSFGQDRQAWGREVIARGFEAMEAIARRSAGRFCVGDAPSVADLCLVPQLYNARRFGVNLEPFETLRRVEAACEELPAFQAAHPDRQPDAPTS